MSTAQSARAGGCPHAAGAEISLLADDARACPYGRYQQLRATDPVKFLPDQNIWIVTRYLDVEYVLENPERFSARESPSSTNAYRNFPDALDILKQSRVKPRARTLMLSDLPHHTRYRAAAQQALAPAKTLRAFAPAMSAIIDELIDGFSEAGACEFVRAFSVPLPMALVAHIFQLPRADIDRLKGWSDSFFAALSGYLPEEVVVRAAHATLEFENFMLDCIASRRREPVDDFLGRLVEFRDEAGGLTDPEIVNMASQILVGGNESTTSLLSNLLHMIATTEGLQQTLADDPSRIPDFIEECLRLEAPLQAMYRITLHEETFDGVAVPAGSKLMLNFGSANRDEAFYQDGERFDLDRDNRDAVHLSFGRGIHACAGQAFARREALIAVQKLVTRLPSIRLSADRPPERATLFGVRAFRTLDLDFDPTPRVGA